MDYDPAEQPVSGAKSILKDIATFAVPVMLGSVFLNALDLVDAAVMMHRLQNAAGFAYEEAMALGINFSQVLREALMQKVGAN